MATVPGGIESLEQKVQRAVLMLRQGEKAAGRQLLKDVLAQDRENYAAWAALAAYAENGKEAEFCLKQVLRLRPNDAWAQRKLQELQGSVEEAVKSTSVAVNPPSVSPPVLSSGGPVIPETVAVPEGTPRQSPREAAAQRRAEAEREAAQMQRSMLIAGGVIGALVLLAAVFVWWEYFAVHPGDKEAIVTAARSWTYVQYRMDYEGMQKLGCSSMRTSSLDPTSLWKG